MYESSYVIEMETTNLDYDELKVGKYFGNVDEVEQFVANWGSKNVSPFVIRSSFKGNEKSNGRLQYACPHAVDRKSRSKGDRPLQKKGLCACVRVHGKNLVERMWYS